MAAGVVDSDGVVMVLEDGEATASEDGAMALEDTEDVDAAAVAEVVEVVVGVEDGFGE